MNGESQYKAKGMVQYMISIWLKYRGSSENNQLYIHELRGNYIENKTRGLNIPYLPTNMILKLLSTSVLCHFHNSGEKFPEIIA